MNTIQIGAREIILDETKPFIFLWVQDTGPESGARCPHCGADGRYIYHWMESGKHRAAMAGCYSALTGKIKKDEVVKFLESINLKNSRNKPLNGWEKNALRLQDFSLAGKFPPDWCLQKISEIVSQRKQYLANKGYRY